MVRGVVGRGIKFNVFKNRNQKRNAFVTDSLPKVTERTLKHKCEFQIDISRVVT